MSSLTLTSCVILWSYSTALGFCFLIDHIRINNSKHLTKLLGQVNGMTYLGCSLCGSFNYCNPDVMWGHLCPLESSLNLTQTPVHVMFKNLAHGFCQVRRTCFRRHPWITKFLHSSGIPLFSSEIPWCKTLVCSHTWLYSHSALSLKNYPKDFGVNVRAFTDRDFLPSGAMSSSPLPPSLLPSFPSRLAPVPPPSSSLIPSSPLPFSSSLSSYVGLPLIPLLPDFSALHIHPQPQFQIPVITMQNNFPFLEALIYITPLEIEGALFVQFLKQPFFSY